jgi:hypothetical protein
MFCGSYTFGHSSLLTLLALGDSSSSKCLIFLGFSLASLLNFHAFLVAIPKDSYTLDGVGFCLCCEYSSRSEIASQSPGQPWVLSDIADLALGAYGSGMATRDLDCQRGDIAGTTNNIKALEFSYFSNLPDLA